MRAALESRWAFLVLLGLLVLGGAFARWYRYELPAGLIFDEHHFVENARNYLAHRADWNDHPPLGKLVLAASITTFGDTPGAWRLPALLLGLLTIILSALAATRLFHSRTAGAVTAALVASDGFFIAYSRTGLIDGQLVALLAASLLLVTTAWRWRTVLGAGLVLGAACTVKFSGVGLALLFCTALALDASLDWRQRLARAVVIALVGFTTYVAIYAFGLSLVGQPGTLASVLADTKRLLSHHAGLTDMKNPWVSGWPTWFLPLRPLIFFREEQAGEVRLVTMLGNLATWWAATAAFVISVAWVLRDGVRVVTTSPSGKATVLLLSAVFGFLAPWVMTHRDSYLYHYLPSYLALVLIVAGAVAQLRERKPARALGFVGLITFVALLYGPLWCGWPLSKQGVDARLVLESWR